MEMEEQNFNLGSDSKKTSHRKIFIFSGILLPIIAFALYQAWVGITLNVFPQSSTIKINGISVSTLCWRDSDCLQVDPKNDYTKCSEVTACGGGDAAVNQQAYISAAQEHQYLKGSQCLVELSDVLAHPDKYAGQKNLLYGCPLGLSDGVKERCFLFRCGLDYVNSL
jgi:hypothetical protein